MKNKILIIMIVIIIVSMLLYVIYNNMNKEIYKGNGNNINNGIDYDFNVNNVPSELLCKWKGIFNGRLSVYNFKSNGMLTITTLGKDVNVPYMISENKLTLLWTDSENQTATFEFDGSILEIVFPSGDSMRMSMVSTMTDNNISGSELNGYYWEGMDSGRGFVYEFKFGGKGTFYANDTVIDFGYRIENDKVILDFGTLYEPGIFDMKKINDIIILIDKQGLEITLFKLN